jgi:hypothetical protein
MIQCVKRSQAKYQVVDFTKFFSFVPKYQVVDFTKFFSFVPLLRCILHLVSCGCQFCIL